MPTYPTPPTPACSYAGERPFKPIYIPYIPYTSAHLTQPKPPLFSAGKQNTREDRMKFLSPMTIKAGDAFIFIPMGEEWLAATNEEDGRVIAAGWPESLVKVSDCKVIRVATQESHRKMLVDASTSGGMRGSWALRQLKDLDEILGT